jgi:hypothetical protein
MRGLVDFVLIPRTLSAGKCSRPGRFLRIGRTRSALRYEAREVCQPGIDVQHPQDIGEPMSARVPIHAIPPAAYRE